MKQKTGLLRTGASFILTVVIMLIMLTFGYAILSDVLKENKKKEWKRIKQGCTNA